METLDTIFDAGPQGFLDESDGASRLRRFICAVNEGLPVDPPPLPEQVATTQADEGDANSDEFQGADRWKVDAIRKWRGLWSGDSRTLKDVFNAEAPEQLARFERAVQGANPWSTFCEFRLDAALMALPPEDENLFEKCILNDQLNYLGTALPEVFSGVVGIGSLGNGDTYHLCLSPVEGETHAVFFFDHETHRFDYVFSVDLESLAYLAALCRAADDELISPAVASKGYEALRKRVAPSWHFGMDERDEDFVGFEPEQAFPIFAFWRSFWMFYLFRQDGVLGVDDLPEQFLPKLNTLLTPEQFAGRLEIAKGSAPTALYAMWRAYLFDEPELARCMEVAHAHPARIVRDAARLIDELQAGRKELGRIRDWPALLARFRALDLDPRRAAEREAEAKAKAAALDAERQALKAQLAPLSGAAELECIQARFMEPGLAWTMVHALLQKPVRSEAMRAFTFLTEGKHRRGNSSYSHEADDACQHLARHSDTALQLALLGSLLARSGGDEAGPVLSGNQVLRILMDGPDLLSTIGRDALAGSIASLSLEKPSWFEHSLVKLAGRLADERFIEPLRRLLAQIPSEGGFETSMHFDDFVGHMADTIRSIGSAAACRELAPFAESASLRMRNARVGSALAIATVAPEKFTETMAARAVEFVSQINDGAENALALIAIAKAMPEYAPARSAKPMSSKPEAKLAQALVAKDPEGIATALDAVFTTRAYDAKYSIERYEVGALACELFGLEATSDALQNATGLSRELDLRLAQLGDLQLPRRISLFEVEGLDEASLAELLRDPHAVGRCHIARIAGHRENLRAPLEQAVEHLAATTEHKLFDDPRHLLREAVQALAAMPKHASTVALFDRLLRHKSTYIKWPVLKILPPWNELKSGMEFVRDQKHGWQEGAAKAWLSEHG
ncbi:MAG: hypothetical protein AAF411_27015 [Myxococcota bacterium]